MTAALTPALALAYLRELSADIRAAIVLDAAGNPLAGPDPLATPARALLAAGPLVSARTKDGAAFGAQDDRHAVVVVTGPFALPRVVHHDLARVLAALREDVSPLRNAATCAGLPALRSGAPATAPSATAEALLSVLR
jgi:hypothetical protein